MMHNNYKRQHGNNAPQRSSPNTPWKQAVTLIRQNGDIVHANGETLRNTSFAVLPELPVYTGEHLRLEALLPDHASQRLERISMNCLVAYVVQLTHPSNALRAGLTIAFIDEENRQHLLRFVREQMRRQRQRNGRIDGADLEGAADRGGGPGRRSA